MAAHRLHVQYAEEDPGLSGIVFRPIQADSPALNQSWIKFEPSQPSPRVSYWAGEETNPHFDVL